MLFTTLTGDRNRRSNYRLSMTLIAERLIEVANQTQQRLRDRPVVADISFVLLIFALEVVDLFGLTADPLVPHGPDAMALALVALGALSLMLRRERPVLGLTLLGGLMVTFYLRDYGSFMSIAGLASLYAVAAHAVNRRLAWIAIVIFEVTLFVVAAFTVMDRTDGFAYSAAAAMSTSMCLAVFVGVVTRNRQQIFMKAEARADEAEADRSAVAEQARTEERLRIARELHDVVAHGMSVIAVQAVAAQEIAPSNPNAAIELMQMIETTSRESLNEMRRMLGVLRNSQGVDDGQHASRGPQPSLVDIEATIEHCRDAGLETEFRVSGEEPALPPGLELTVYRIVQEALTNVLKHGGPAAMASVELSYSHTTLDVKISDTGRGVIADLDGTNRGNGLVGMRERVELYDGTMAAGPQPGGGYIVTAMIPLDSQMRRSRVVSAEQPTPEHSA
jgi:signal transduction histidine kinase